MSHRSALPYRVSIKVPLPRVSPARQYQSTVAACFSDSSESKHHGRVFLRHVKSHCHMFLLTTAVRNWDSKVNWLRKHDYRIQPFDIIILCWWGRTSLNVTLRIICLRPMNVVNRITFRTSPQFCISSRRIHRNIKPAKFLRIYTQIKNRILMLSLFLSSGF
jgi:hypothetical protein